MERLGSAYVYVFQRSAWLKELKSQMQEWGVELALLLDWNVQNYKCWSLVNAIHGSMIYWYHCIQDKGPIITQISNFSSD